MLVNKFAGKCRYCDVIVPPNGGTVDKYGKHWRVAHLSCAGKKAPSVVGISFGSGETFTRNANGRCEDAPCCGCCIVVQQEDVMKTSVRFPRLCGACVERNDNPQIMTSFSGSGYTCNICDCCGLNTDCALVDMTKPQGPSAPLDVRRFVLKRVWVHAPDHAGDSDCVRLTQAEF
jgi:hypothetical protein